MRATGTLVLFREYFGGLGVLYMAMFLNMPKSYSAKFPVLMSWEI
jgi:hypothetical protein